MVPLLSGKDGYWTTLDWDRALGKGQDAVGLPFSGRFDFVETAYVFPITHMVAPKENTLACTECKQRNYTTTKNKKNTPDRLESKKFNPILKKMTVHKEIK